jgi:hypothetical protein
MKLRSVSGGTGANHMELIDYLTNFNLFLVMKKDIRVLITEWRDLMVATGLKKDRESKGRVWETIQKESY